MKNIYVITIYFYLLTAVIVSFASSENWKDKTNILVEKNGQYRCRDGAKLSEDREMLWQSLDNLYPEFIPNSSVCDGLADCIDQDDEANCKNIECTDRNFECEGYARSAICIPHSWSCDGQKDCRDGFDEEACSDTLTPCYSSDFTCADGQCISGSWRCDQKYDCSDKSDEENCKPVLCHPDEKNCTTANTGKKRDCTGEELMCDHGMKCIHVTFVCDGDKDCVDGSDEINCPNVKEQKCVVGEKLCDDGICRSSCHPLNPCDSDDSYKCGNKSCISYRQLCTDESPVNDCWESVCHQKIHQCDPTDSFCRCRDTHAHGQICFCPVGFDVVNRKCVDVDECRTPGICDQKCFNLLGSYRCECHPGFHLTGGPTADGGIRKLSKCRAVGSESIRQFNLLTNHYYPVLENQGTIGSFDYWHAEKTIIWTDVSNKRIMKCTLRDNNRVDAVGHCSAADSLVLIEQDIDSPVGLAVDWVHGLLFWTDTGLVTVNVYDFISSKNTVLFNKDVDRPTSIAVDPSAGLIFWVDQGATGRIERAGMDGSNRVSIWSSDALKQPTGLTVDLYGRRVYWSDAKSPSIWSCNYWGDQLRQVVDTFETFGHPFSLSVFEDRIYRTDLAGILSANKVNGDEMKAVAPHFVRPQTIRIYHEMAQPRLRNVCEKHGCDNICLPRAVIDQKRHDLPYRCVALPGKSKCFWFFCLAVFTLILIVFTYVALKRLFRYMGFSSISDSERKLYFSNVSQKFHMDESKEETLTANKRSIKNA